MLEGKVALITGGSSGLGYLLAREFARAGCKVAICARDEGELNAARDQLTQDGAEVFAVRCDVSEPEQVRSLIDSVSDHFGRIDILVNNAGIIQFGPFQAMDVSNLERAMDVIFWGTVNPTLSVLPQMRERGSGRIVNVTSIGGKVSVPHLIAYDSAKFAATGFSEGLRAELMQDGITVTTIAPGLMRTGSYFNAEFQGDAEKEFTWFSLGSSLPLITMDAERAAQQIVQATRRGEAERILSIPANILVKFNGLFPGLTSDILARVDRYILPDANGSGGRGKPGREVQSDLDSSAQEAATVLGRESARQFQPEENLPEEVRNDRGD
jgi:short-subunit dehydrogenase